LLSRRRRRSPITTTMTPLLSRRRRHSPMTTTTTPLLSHHRRHSQVTTRPCYFRLRLRLVPKLRTSFLSCTQPRPRMLHPQSHHVVRRSRSPRHSAPPPGPSFFM
jgi:hypothetical protein